MLKLDPPRVQRSRLQQVPLRADQGDGRCDNLFPDRVDRRIGDLGEQLLEIVVQQLVLAGEYRQRSIGAHRAERLHAVGRHRPQDNPLILIGIAERLLALVQRCVIRKRSIRNARQIFQSNVALFQPLPVGVGRRQFQFDLLVRNDATLLRINQEHLPRLEPPFLQDTPRIDLENSGFGGHDDQTIAGYVVS